MEPELITPDQLEVNSDTSEASFGCALDLMAKDADAKAINEIKIKDERIDLSDLFNALSPYKTQTNHVPTSDFDDIMKSIDDDIKSRMNDEG